MYDTTEAAAVYRNFLNWLFATFDEDEAAFRQSMIARLKLAPGSRLLITGCGLGDDLFAVLDAHGGACRVHACDLSAAMVEGTAQALARRPAAQRDAVELSVCDACELPFADGSFDAAFHFGGINLFPDPARGIAEMTRVVREGGRVVFGDEGVAPWLKDTDYGRMVVANNPLWAADSLIASLPFAAVNVNLAWLLGNCFYLIDFDKQSAGPRIDPDVPHIGWKGGTMRTRHAGRVEGITPQLKQRLYAFARRSGRSVHDLLEAAVNEKLAQHGD
jgi:SAM-dependent methyltransferase